MELPSTKPYLIRAIHEWCCDHGFTPYITVKTGKHTRVPREFVHDGQIVLNIAYEATGHLKIANDGITFQARFGGVARDISVPIGNVIAIYARENGAGMAFEPELTINPVRIAKSSRLSMTRNQSPCHAATRAPQVAADQIALPAIEAQVVTGAPN